MPLKRKNHHDFFFFFSIMDGWFACFLSFIHSSFSHLLPKKKLEWNQLKYLIFFRILLNICGGNANLFTFFLLSTLHIFAHFFLLSLLSKKKCGNKQMCLNYYTKMIWRISKWLRLSNSFIWAVCFRIYFCYYCCYCTFFALTIQKNKIK